MTPKIKSKFFFMTCNFGSEKALIHEVSKLEPKLKLGFSKKGFVTFKSETDLGVNFRLESVFARTQGISLERFKLEEGDISPLSDYIADLEKKFPTSLVHVFPRSRKASEEEDDLVKLTQKVQIVYDKEVKHPDVIIDVVYVEENEVWVGMHKVEKDDYILPGNRPDISLPPEAPSRAYLKIAEAFWLTKPKIKSGDTIMEIGSSPGGASYYLLTQGFKVIGVDSAVMDTVVMKNPNFTHLKKTAGSVTKADVEAKKVAWLAMDINVKPDIAFLELKKLLPLLTYLEGALLTFKIPNQDGFLKVNDYIKRVKKLGFGQITAKQLFYNRQEIFIFAKK
jgi:23S rRNA (cytidine2498-2'-O)-methyltransferase